MFAEIVTCSIMPCIRSEDNREIVEGFIKLIETPVVAFTVFSLAQCHMIHSKLSVWLPLRSVFRNAESSYFDN
jgi:hypothetical protein